VTVEEGRQADEIMMLIGSGELVLPVLQWDNQIFGDGEKHPCNILSILQTEIYVEA
jgi:4-amino-4-deoxychorismate lyase